MIKASRLSLFSFAILTCFFPRHFAEAAIPKGLHKLSMEISPNSQGECQTLLIKNPKIISDLSSTTATPLWRKMFKNTKYIQRLSMDYVPSQKELHKSFLQPPVMKTLHFLTIKGVFLPLKREKNLTKIRVIIESKRNRLNDLQNKDVPKAIAPLVHSFKYLRAQEIFLSSDLLEPFPLPLTVRNVYRSPVKKLFLRLPTQDQKKFLPSLALLSKASSLKFLTLSLGSFFDELVDPPIKEEMITEHKLHLLASRLDEFILYADGSSMDILPCTFQRILIQTLLDVAPTIQLPGAEIHFPDLHATKNTGSKSIQSFAKNLKDLKVYIPYKNRPSSITDLVPNIIDVFKIADEN